MAATWAGHRRRICLTAAGVALLAVAATAGASRRPLRVAPGMPVLESPYPGAFRGLVVQVTAEPRHDGLTAYGLVVQCPLRTADGDPQTPDGIFVGLGTNCWIYSRQHRERVVLSVGDEIIVRGQWDRLGTRPALVNASLLRLVRQGADIDRDVPPFEADPPADAAAAERYWERRHAMRCRVPAGSVVQGVFAADFSFPLSMITVIRPDHPLLRRAEPYARRVFRDAHPLDDLDPLVDNGNGFRIPIAVSGADRAPGALSTVPPARTFDRLADDVVGVVLQVSEESVILVGGAMLIEHGAEPDANGPPPFRRSAEHLSMATYNVENLYDHRDDPFDPQDFADSAGGGPPPGQPARLKNYVPASEDVYRERLRALAKQIVLDLESPDLLLLQELEDQDIGFIHDGRLVTGTVDNRDGRLDVLQELALEVLRVGGPLYRSAADRWGADDRGIICGFLYRDDRLKLRDVDVDTPLFGAVPLTPFPGQTLAPRYAPTNPRALNGYAPAVGSVFSRAPQVACFQRAPGAALALPAGRPLYVVNNHFKSRPNVHVELRTAQARLAAAIAAAIRETDAASLIVVGGDLNTFARPDEPIPELPGDQLGPLYEAGLVNLFDRLLEQDPASAYTTVYRGQAQTLDQLFLSPDLAARLCDARVLHINSDYGIDPRRPTRHASDHDPVLAVFQFTAP